MRGPRPITNRRWLAAIADRRWRLPIALATGLLLATVVPTGGLLSGDAAGGGDLWGLALDAWLHALGFGALAASIAWVSGRCSLRVVLGAITVTIAFGAGIELLQVPIPWRTGSVADLLANAIGAVAGATIAGAGRSIADGESADRSER